MEPRIRLLGSCKLHDPDGREIALPTRKSWGLLAYLALAGDRELQREELAALLWPRAADGQARASLRQELAVLKKALARAGIDAIRASKDRVRFEVHHDLIDVTAMEHLLPLDDRDARRAAVAFHRGDFLRDLKVRAGPFEEWTWLERQRLKGRVISALQKLLDHDLSQDDIDQGVATAEQLLAIDPSHEQAYRALMRLYQRAGRRTDALRQYQLCSDMLRRELDAEPSPETTVLAAEIRQRSQPTATEMRAPPVERRVFVLALQLGGLEDFDQAPSVIDLALAQDRLLRKAKAASADSHGLILESIGAAFVVVFDGIDIDGNIREGAIRAALSLCAEPVRLNARQALWPRAGLDIGDALLGRPAANGQGAVLVGAVLRRALALCQDAGNGQVLVSNRVGYGLPTSFQLADLTARAPELKYPGQIVGFAQ